MGMTKRRDQVPGIVAHSLFPEEEEAEEAEEAAIG